MKALAISTREFRDNQRKYLDLVDAQEQRIIIQRGRNKAYIITPLEFADDTEYLLSTGANARNLMRSLEQLKKNKGESVNIAEIWK